MLRAATMKHEAEWVPTKYAIRGGRLHAGPEARGAVWLVAELVAEGYDRLLAEHARGRLVDLGCGNVPLYAAYRERASAVTCVDWGASAHGARHLDVTADLGEPLPFEDEAFDTVILSDVLEHIARPDALLKEIARVLAPGGRLVGNTPFLYWLHEQPHDHYRYTEHALRVLVRAAGLDPLLVEPFGGGLEVITDVVAKHAAVVPVVGRPLAESLGRGVHWLTGSKLARRALAASRQRFPLGYFFVAERSRSVD
jgi:SAM-dependent methyltransferase